MFQQATSHFTAMLLLDLMCYCVLLVNQVVNIKTIPQRPEGVEQHETAFSLIGCEDRGGKCVGVLFEATLIIYAS